MKTETLMPKFESYRQFKPVWKYQKKCCSECDKEYLTDNMMGIEVKKIYIWYCLRCYNFLKP